jgi:hypothetical protein
MCSLEGTSITMPFTPVSTDRFTSSFMQRENAKISAGRFFFTMALMALASIGETAGMPASIRCTPASASMVARRTFSSGVNSTPACCSPSRRHTS